MAIDEAIMRSLAEEDVLPTLRFYRWLYPCISIGRFQEPLTLPSPLRGEGESLPLVRRPTGGGSVFHNESSITYSILYKEDLGAIPKGLLNSYREIHCGISGALKEIDINTVFHLSEERVKPQGKNECFKLPVKFDLMHEGKKIAGAAQRRRYGVVLHQGEVSLELDVWSRWSYNDILNAFISSFSRQLKAKFVKGWLSENEAGLANKLLNIAGDKIER